MSKIRATNDWIMSYAEELPGNPNSKLAFWRTTLLMLAASFEANTRRLGPAKATRTANVMAANFYFQFFGTTGDWRNVYTVWLWRRRLVRFLYTTVSVSQAHHTYFNNWVLLIQAGIFCAMQPDRQPARSELSDYNHTDYPNWNQLIDN